MPATGDRLEPHASNSRYLDNFLSTIRFNIMIRSASKPQRSLLWTKLCTRRQITNVLIKQLYTVNANFSLWRL